MVGSLMLSHYTLDEDHFSGRLLLVTQPSIPSLRHGLHLFYHCTTSPTPSMTVNEWGEVGQAYHPHARLGRKVRTVYGDRQRYRRMM